MTSPAPRPSLAGLMEAATTHVESDLDGRQTWEAGVRRRRTYVGRVAVAATAAAVLAVTAILVSVTGRGPSTDQPSRLPTTPLQTDNVADSPYLVRREHVLPAYDPADWESLPEYGTDLGWWAQADGLVSLADDPVDRASAVVQVMLGEEKANIWVFGDDGRWRSLDTTGLSLVDNGEYSLGVGRGSLSPDGTRLAIGQAEGVVVVDLTTGEPRNYPIEGLGEVWTGRQTFWTPDGAAVLVALSFVYASPPDDLAYQDGWRVELADGSVSRVPYDPAHTAQFADGSMIVNHWSERTQHQWFLDHEGQRTQLELEPMAVYQEGPMVRGQRWAARRELTIYPENRQWDRDGFIVRDADGLPVSVLPVVGVEKNGGGGAVLGWVDDDTVLFAMPRPGDWHTAGVVAWDVDTGELFRGPLLLENETVSIGVY